MALMEVVNKEIQSLTDNQKRLHFTSSIEEEIICNYHRDFYKTTWHSTIPAKLPSTNNGDGISYKVDNNFHSLEYTYLLDRTLEVTVKPKYRNKVRIAYCPYYGFSRILRGLFIVNKQTWQTLDFITLDILKRYYSEGKEEAINKSIGHIDSLIQWTTHLPSIPLIIPQAWFYSKDTSLAFPIFYFGSEVVIEHIYRFRSKLKDVLRIQIFTNGIWKDVNMEKISDLQINKLSNYLSVDLTTTLPIPEMWGRYSRGSPQEHDFLKNCKGVYTFYFKDIIACDSDKEIGYDKQDRVDLKCVEPCEAIFFMFENIEASNIHNFLNYNTNTVDYSKGKDPLKCVTLKYGMEIFRFEKMDAVHFSHLEPLIYFSSVPKDVGYHVHCYASTGDTMDVDIGVSLNALQASLIYETIRDDNNNDDSLLSEDEEDIGSLPHIDEEPVKIQDSDIDIKDQFKLETNTNISIFESYRPQKFLPRIRLLRIREVNIIQENGQYKINLI